MQNQNIDHGNKFDWGKTSEDYAKYRDIYPKEFYAKLAELSLGVILHRIKLHRQSSFRKAWRLLIWFPQRKRCQHLQSRLTGLQRVNVIGISMLQKQLQRLHGY